MAEIYNFALNNRDLRRFDSIRITTMAGAVKDPAQQQSPEQAHHASSAASPLSASLTCIETLLPPLDHIAGTDTDTDSESALVYRTSQTAWQCTFSMDGTWLAVCYGSPNPCVRIWKHHPSSNQEDASQDASSWILQKTLSGIHQRTIRSIDFAPIRSPVTLACASFDGTVTLWEHSSSNNNNNDDDGEWDCTAQLEGHESEVKCVTWNATGSLLATCGRDKTVWIWECFLPGSIGGPAPTDHDFGSGSELECLAVLNGHEADVKTVKFAASHGQWGDGDEILLSASYDDTIRIWAEDAGDWYCASLLSNVHTSTIWTLAVAPSSSRLISGSDDGSLAIYKCYTAEETKERFPDEQNGSNGTWKCVGKLPDAHAMTVYSVDYASARCGHGRVVSGGADNRIQVYREARESKTDKPLFFLDASVKSPHGDVNCVCWHPWDGSILASAGDDGAVRLWRYRSAP